MKACVLHAIHDLRYEDHVDPKIQNDDELIVRILRAGICGSDVHYYQEGKVGATTIVKHPFIIGHEGVGIVEAVGRSVTKANSGDMVVIRPSRPCFNCIFCQKGQYTYCLHMAQLGSASTMPHTNGLFADKVRVHNEQVYKVKMSPEIAAFAEPVGVALNGVRSLGGIIGKKVLVTGAGPIGALCAAVAKTQGAKSVTIIDVRQLPLDLCKKMGIDETVNSRENPEIIDHWKQNRGHFDALLEASGSSDALTDGLEMLKPEGTVAQVGVFPVGKEPTNLAPFLSKGIKWVGVFRFYDEFNPAIQALENGWINPLPLLSDSYPAENCVEAMQATISGKKAKIQLVFSEQSV